MRKLTGYIGALIVVFALMGSILAGYALNVNGESTVINEYEKVTDVSGLYTHSQEPSYIEYNPASNYIGYSIPGPTDLDFTNTNDYKASYKRYSGGFDDITTSRYNGNVYNNGVLVSNTQPGNYTGLGAYYVWLGENFTGWIYQPTDSAITMAYDITTWNGSTPTTTTRYTNDITISYANNTITIQADGNTFNVFCRWLYIPANGGDISVIYTHDAYIIDPNNYYSNGGATITRIYEYDGLNITNPLYHVEKDNASPWNVYFVPTNVSYRQNIEKGINYTQSARVNNYLMETTDTTISTTTQNIGLDSIGAPDQFYYNSQGIKQIGFAFNIYSTSYNINGEYISPIVFPSYTITAPAYQPAHDNIYDSNNPNWYYDGWHNIKLSDVLASYNIPLGTTSIKITTDSAFSQSFTGAGVTIDKNLVWFSYLPNMLRDYGAVPSLNSEVLKKDFLIYDVGNNIATVYTYDGTIRYSGSPDDISIFYYTNDVTYKGVWRYRADADHYTTSFFYDMNDRPEPSIKITATIATPGTLKYADITKGYAIKSTNTANTIWNNNYQNGTINILFRANDVNQTYHNDLIILDNNIAVDFENNRFYVTLGTNERVDIGTWRNIILNVDLTNGYLSAIPVRTFNSFTNVIMDNTGIGIGELTGGGSANIIKWAPTPNSLMFNIYSTSVFMNTYGVVMVNPTINITDYFTDLNNFYRMRLFNFSVLGDSITVNGITADVVNNTITIDGQTIQLKEMAITYADGHAYISDSNASIDLGEIADNNISMAGAWYFETELQRGYTSQKMIYNWNWGDFILNNTQFCIMFMGLAVVALIVARRYCTMAITDYIVLVLSFIIALTVQVVA